MAHFRMKSLRVEVVGGMGLKVLRREAVKDGERERRRSWREGRGGRSEGEGEGGEIVTYK